MVGPNECAANASLRESLLEHSFQSSCSCAPTERNICFVEGTQLDKNISSNVSELTENVWYEIKPPKLFLKQMSPLVSSRQIYISRATLNGKLGSSDERKPEELRHRKEEKPNISMQKKKSARRFLEDTKVDFDQ